MYTCESCGNVFEPSKYFKEQKYCSKDCQHKTYMKKYNKEGARSRKQIGQKVCAACDTKALYMLPSKIFNGLLCSSCDRKLKTNTPIQSDLISPSGSQYHGRAWWLGRKIGRNTVFYIPFEPLCQGVHVDTRITMKCPQGHMFAKQVPNAGAICPHCVKEAKHRKEAFQKAELPDGASFHEWKELWLKYTGITILDCLAHDWPAHSKVSVFARCWCGREWDVRWDNVTRGRIASCGCLTKISQANDEIYEVLKTNGIDAVLEYPLENLSIDVYVPGIGLAIEHHGLNWHEGNKDVQKFNLCKRNGLKYLGIYEDEWKYKRKLMEHILLNQVGVQSGSELDLDTIGITHMNVPQVVEDFLETWGRLKPVQTVFSSKEQYIGAYNRTGELVALICYTVAAIGSLRMMQIKDLAMNHKYRIDGLWKHMLEWIIKTLPFDRIQAFSDFRFNNDKTYIDMGLKPSGKSIQEDFWISNGKRYCISEIQKEGWTKISDCGHMLYQYGAEIAPELKLPRLYVYASHKAKENDDEIGI